MCAYAGFDFVIIDNEHGSAGLESTENMLRAAGAAGIAALVRCLKPDIGRVLDIGAAGVLIPMVERANEAADLVATVKYPPMGRRGSAFSSRAAEFGAFPGNSHTEMSNNGVVLIAMVETPLGMKNILEIAGSEGVSAIFIRPNDLSHAMGFGNN